MSISITAAVAQAAAAAVATSIGAGSSIRIYSGTKPATPETAATGTLLATVAISGSFTATSGVLTSADPAAVTPAAAGTAGWFRLLTSGGTAILDGTVGTSGADMNLSSTSITTAASSLDLGIPAFTMPVA
jgi:hypothetical protein